jgi:hypothetical protein
MVRPLAWLPLILSLGCTLAPTSSPPAPASTVPQTSASPASSPPPATSTNIVLRMTQSGGFLYPGTTLDVAPAFTLYGDGSVIYRPSGVPQFGPPGRAGGLRRAHMDGEQMDALFAFALGPGGLADAGELYADVPVADSMSTIFTIAGGGVSKTVSVYALGDEMEPGPETAHRQRFSLLARLLGSFEAEVARGNATDAGEFEAQAYRVVLFPDEFGELAPSAEWPWQELAPDDFERDRSGFGVRLLSADEAEPLFDLPAADIGDPVVVGPDEVNYLVRYRPLLPDELD